MRTLVTGSTGFVGHWMMDHLRHVGDEVVVLDAAIDIVDGESVTKAVAELKPDSVIHLAGWADVGASWEDPGGAFSVNAEGTRVLLDACRRLETPPKTLVVSSAEVYGVPDASGTPAGEHFPLRPVSPYAVSKVAAEFLALQSFLAWELPVVVVRAFNHIGPGQSPNFVVSALAKRIVSAMKQGHSTVEIGNLSARRDFTDVRDVVRAYRMLVNDGAAGEVYNVCSGTAIEIADIASRLIAVSGANLELQPTPALMRPVDVPLIIGDNSKLTQGLGWKPEVNIDDSLRDILSYWRDQPHE